VLVQFVVDERDEARMSTFNSRTRSTRTSHAPKRRVGKGGGGPTAAPGTF